MFVSSVLIRVPYADTDQMGVVYYGNYARYFETARTEALRSVGLAYRQLEAQGVMLPVRILQVQYLAPAHYDDLLEVHTELREVPSARIRFDHRIRRQGEDRDLITGWVELVFVDADTRRPRRCPPALADLFAPYFNGAAKKQPPAPSH
jgi:acyl-CoA thioester hydrolase, YbgC/YbaW family